LAAPLVWRAGSMAAACVEVSAMLALALEHVEFSGWIAAWAAANELEDVVELARLKLGRYLVDAPLMKQANRRYYGWTPVRQWPTALP
jgi:hypothetical protein